jgi:D-tyrosyl-tRNA(Tyr) deacylase
MVDQKLIGKVGNGLVLLIGVAQTDTESDVYYTADKCAMLRIFADDENKMNRSVIDVNGEVLAISQFTLLGDITRGRRPSFIAAAEPERGEMFYQMFVSRLREHGLHVETGIFGAMMDVHLVNAGPVTLIVDSKR